MEKNVGTEIYYTNQSILFWFLPNTGILFISLYSSIFKKIINIFNEKIVNNSKKSILQVATEFGLMKLVKFSIDEFKKLRL